MQSLSISHTHLRLVLLSRQAPHTMPTMSSTPRAPAATPPVSRPIVNTLMEPSPSTRGRVTITVQTEIIIGAVIERPWTTLYTNLKVTVLIA